MLLELTKRVKTDLVVTSEFESKEQEFWKNNF